MKFNLFISKDIDIDIDILIDIDIDIVPALYILHPEFILDI